MASLKQMVSDEIKLGPSIRATSHHLRHLRASSISVIWRSLWGNLLCTTNPPRMTITCTATFSVSDSACTSYSSSIDKPILTMIGWLKTNVAPQASSFSDCSSTSVLPRSWCRTNSYRILATKYTVKLSTTRNHRSFRDKGGERSDGLIWVRGVAV